MKGALSFVGAPALVASLGEVAGLSLIALLLGSGLELGKGGVEVRQGRHARDDGKKIRTGTGETYRYPYVRVTASAVWCCRIFLVRGVLVISAHHVTRCSIMGIIILMKPTVEGSGPGRRGQRDVGVGVMG